jgi:hypothetical protein
MKKGDKVKPKKGKGHGEGHEDMTMTIDHISDEKAIAVKMDDGIIHKWYVESELEKIDGTDSEEHSGMKTFSRALNMKNFAFGNIRAFDRAKAEETREIEFIISSDDKDRHGTRLNMKGWNLENFNMNPIVGYQHNVYGGNMCQPDNPDNVLGPGRAFLEEDRLIGAVTFETKEINPLAEKIFQKVLNGTLRATSVGFLEVGNGKYGDGEERQGGKNETYYFSGQELLEFSIVNIPSNAKAVGRSMVHHADAALAYLIKFMPETVSIRDIKSMTVQQVLDHVKGTVTEKQVEQIETIKKDRIALRMAIMKHELKTK